MAVKSLDESNRLFAVEIDMENRSPDEIAKDAALQIIAIFDRLNKEQKEKMIKTLYEIFQHWSVKGSVYLLSDLHLNDDDDRTFTGKNCAMPGELKIAGGCFVSSRLFCSQY